MSSQTSSFSVTARLIENDRKGTKMAHVTTQQPKKYTIPGNITLPVGSFGASYLSTLMLLARVAAGVSTAEAKQHCGLASWPCLDGRALPPPNKFKKLGLAAKLQAMAPDLFARPGFGDVLRAYERNEPVHELFDPQLMELIKANSSNQSDNLKRNVLLFFGLKDKIVQRPKNQDADDRASARAFVCEELCASSDFLDGVSPSPIEPDSRIAAIAQERVLSNGANLHRWEDSALKGKHKMIAQEAQKLDPGALDAAWRDCAKKLLLQHFPAAHEEAANATVGGAAALVGEMEKLIAAEGATTPALRRVRHLLRYSS